MPLWIYVYTPWVMAAYILVALALNFGLLCAASTCVESKPKKVRFALDRLTVAFMCAAAANVAGFGIMGAFLTYGDIALQNSLSECNYDKSTVWVPILAVATAMIISFLLTRFVLIGKRVEDKMNRTMLSGCFALLNAPYILLIPMVI